MLDRVYRILAALFLVAFAAESAQAVSRIAFFSFREANYDIYAMNADGSGLTRLTHDPGDDHVPAWAPDGQSIAFSSRRDGDWEIYLMDANGTNQVNLTNHSSHDYDPSFSPDGSRIVFNTRRNVSTELYAMDADGSNLTRLTNNSLPDVEPAWSPDGTRIAFRALRGGDYEILVINADGTGEVNLTNNPARDQSPSWSADGSQIAFESDREGDRHVFVMDADGSNPTRITNNPSYSIFPTWSPTGAQISLIQYSDGNQNVFVMDADGSNPIALTTNVAADYSPDWSKELAEPAITLAMETTSASVSEGDGPQILRIVLSTGGPALVSPVSASLALSGSATTPLDYGLSAQTVSFPAGSADGSSVEIILTLVDDSLFEGTEFVGIAIDGATLTGPVSLGWPGAHSIALQDNELAGIRFGAGPTSLAEGDAPATLQAVLEVSGGTLASEVSVDVAAAGTASSPGDYGLDTTSVVFPAGSADGAVVDLSLTVVDDNLVEGDEQVILSLDPASLAGAAVLSAPTTHSVTITDNDAATVAFVLAASSLSEAAASAPVQVILDTGGSILGAAASVSVALGGSATPSSDYTLTPQSVNFPAGSADGATANMTFAVVDDLLVEGTEQALVSLDPGSVTGPATVGSPSSHDVTIVDDDLGTPVPASWARGLWVALALLALGSFVLRRKHAAPRP